MHHDPPCVVVFVPSELCSKPLLRLKALFSALSFRSPTSPSISSKSNDDYHYSPPPKPLLPPFSSPNRSATIQTAQKRQTHTLQQLGIYTPTRHSLTLPRYSNSRRQDNNLCMENGAVRIQGCVYRQDLEQAQITRSSEPKIHLQCRPPFGQSRQPAQRSHPTAEEAKPERREW